MSASREKKQRQEVSEEIKISRAQEEQEKAARRKRNTIIYSIIGAVIAILVAALLIWDSGVIQRNQTVATINGEKVTASEIAYYYYNHTILQTAQLYNQYGIYDFPYSLYDSPKNQTITKSACEELGIDESYVDKTYHDLFLDFALDNLRVDYALLAAAEEAGYTLSEDGKATVDLERDSLDDTLDQYLSYYGADLTRTAYLQMVYGDSMNERKYFDIYERIVLADEFFANNFDALTDYTEEELDAYYEAHKVDLTSVSYYWRFFDGSVEETKDEDGKTIEPTEEEEKAALEAAKKEAEDAQAKVDADFDMVKDNEDYTNSDGVPNVTNFAYDWLIDSERKEGDTKIFDGTNGYYLVVFEKSYRDERNTVNLRHILISAMAEDDPETEDVDESKEDPTDEAFEAAKKKAQELLDQWKAGDATSESFGDLVEANTADTATKSNGGLYEKVYQGRMIDTFDDWIFDEARQEGDTGLVKNTESSKQGWHIIYYIGEDEPVWVTNARNGKWSEDTKASVEVVCFDNLDSHFA